MDHSSNPNIQVRMRWDSDLANPFNWSPLKKWRVMALSCLVTFLVGLNSTSVTTAFPEISTDFSIDNSELEYVFFTVTSWNFSAALFPMISLPLMDSRGTYIIYSISYTLFLIFAIPQALAQNFATLVVTRIFAGAFGGTIQNAAEGIAANLFKTSRERLSALSIYIFALVAGVTLGPVQGSIVGGLSWRWVFWTQVIIYGTVLPLVLFGLPETRGHIIQRRKYGNLEEAKEMKENNYKESEDTAASTGIIREIGLSARLLTTELTVFFFMLWCAFSFGLIFISTESVALVFTTSFGFEEYQAGLVQVSMFLGEVVGLVTCFWSNKYYAKSKMGKHQPNIDSQCEKSNKSDQELTVKNRSNAQDMNKPIPEKALHVSIPATILFLCGGLLVYAWTSYPSIPWVAPAVGLGMQGCAIQIIVTAVTIYITDSYEQFAASAIAGIAFGENTFAAFLPLACLPLYSKLGCQWAGSLLAFLALTLAGAPIMLALKGPKIRAKSKAIKEMAW